MIPKRKFLLGVLLLAAGCSSSYQLRPQALGLRSTLDESRALDTVRSTFAAHGYGRGLRLEGRKLTFLASQSKYGGSRIQSGQLTTKEVQVVDQSSLQLDKLTKIRVKPLPPRSDGIRGFTVEVADGPGAVALNELNEEEVDRLMASLTFLSPNALLVSGYGL